MPLYQHVLRPALFSLSGDRSHQLARLALRWPLPWKLLAAAQGLAEAHPSQETTFAGVKLSNPIGLAAGFDKDCDLIESLSALGFGFLCVGSIMPSPRPGNLFPRVVRYTDRASLADSMGVPSRGRPYALERLKKLQRRTVPIFANIGGFSPDEIGRGVREVLPYVDAVEISLMCPNVLKPGERFNEIDMLRGVLTQTRGLERSLVIRVPNDTTAAPSRLAELVEICVDAGVGGLKVGGGHPVIEPRLGSGRGTLHGRAIFENALRNVALASDLARGRIAIKGNGGIRSADDARAMFNAGAICVDLYSAFIFEGWTIARDINRDLTAEGARIVPGHGKQGSFGPPTR